MEATINHAKDFLNSDQGKQLKDQLFGGENKPTGDPQADTGNASFDAQGNQGAPGQFGQEGQYGAVRGGGLGGALQQEKQSDYEGMDVGDSTASGGYGRNPQGDAFSRQNQMGADNQNHGNPGGASGDYGSPEGYKTGYSTPGYRKEGDDEDDNARRANQNVYGKQADDRGAKGNDYNEADI
ncbi:hypothetical protein I316_06083 [Kwoniella heveanensis BCC8398]|uniref:Uncharacterized protein n=1 Tax=Kwoniella heveanensis BCC8398 TaxID=1296120 RepID=A0A1B9GM52_9TREE|nr:hypothetical protein I316_06083 [Kwoniella heveanensis BCC8398]